MPFLVILLLFGGGIVLCEFHFEARAEETVLGPFIPVMSSLPFCHSSICLKFFFFFLFFCSKLDCCRVQSFNRENFLVGYVGSDIMLNILKAVT